ncbi:MAG: hypothetical protein JWN44_7086 [Myxococcales bacterium]|nr:hypothetical protein [Myxococcales bacterium]
MGFACEDIANAAVWYHRSVAEDLEELARRLARAVTGHVDGVLKVFLPLVESRGEHRIACGDGCSACCANFVRCSVPEALVVAEWLDDPAHADVRARFVAKLPGWRARAGNDPTRIEAHLARHGGSGDAVEWDAYQKMAVAYARKQNLCAFNDDQGRCDIYEVRPLICRSVYVLETADNCVPDRAPPQIVSHPALEEAFREATHRCAEAAARIGRDPEPHAIPEAVARALGLPGLTPMS